MRLKLVFPVLVFVWGCLTVLTPDGIASFPHYKQNAISNVSLLGVTSNSATVSWRTAAAADSQVEYGTTTAYGSLTTLNPALSRTHSETMSGLTPNTLYHFAVMSHTTQGVRVYAGDFTFTTPPVMVPGMISALQSSGISPTSATISWTTITPANSLLEFGATPLYGQGSPLSTEFVTAHTIVLAGLTPATVYHFRAKSTDAMGNLGISDDAAFTTPENDTPAGMGGMFASSVTGNSATITWDTTAPSSSQVDYGIGQSYGISTVKDSTLVNVHSQTLGGLTPHTLYHYRVRSVESDGTVTTSGDCTFETTGNYLYYPQLSPDQDSFTGIALSNLSPASAQLTFTAFNAAGLETQADSLTNPVSKSLGAGSQMANVQDQLFGGGVSSSWPFGWTLVDSSTPRVAGFFLTFNSALSFMDGTAVSTTLLNTFVLPETGDHDYTTVLIANPNPVDASLTLDLVKADGTVRSSAQATIPAFESYSADLLTGTFAGIASDPSDYVRVVSSQGMLPYEFFGNVSKDVAVLLGQEASGGGDTLYSPQYVAGGPWNSMLSVVNLDAQAGSVTLRWIGDDGSPVGTPQTVPIAANGKLYISDPSFFQFSPAQVTQGYLQITASGIHITGSVVFSDAAKGEFLTALPLVATLLPSQLLSHIASDETYFTGISILNPNPADATVKVDLYTSTGAVERSSTQDIKAGSRFSRLVTEIFPELKGQQRDSGYLKITSDKGLACFGVFGTQSLSVLSSIPAQPAQ